MTRALQAVSGVTQVADGAASAVSTTYQYDADMLRAEAKKLHAWILRHQNAIDMMTEDLGRMFQELQSGMQVVSSIISGNHDTKTKMLGKIKA